ncbi:unnamed protein product [Trichobilharzia regenti]|nr:unnamed protein product [Trichobilharzia regenti]
MTNALRLSNLVVRCSDPTVNSSVLICHGLLGSKQNWKSVSHTLAQKKCGTVVAVDLRNHGNSPHSDSMSYLHMSKDISKVVDDLKLQQVCLLGHSMGGKAVMCASLMTVPEKYDKLVVLDISPVTKPSVQSLYPIVDLLSSVNLEEIGRKCGGNLAAVRSFLMEDWKEAVPVSRSFLENLSDEQYFPRVFVEAFCS